MNGVRSRRFVWSDPTVQELASRFVAVVDDEGVLRESQTEEGKLYRHIVDDLGHFKGKLDEHNNNKQGIYCIAPSGEFLASVYSIEDPQPVAEMLRQALKKWASLPEDKRFAIRPIDPRGATLRTEQIYPHDGLVLVEHMRDLPRIPPHDETYAGSWNKNFAWFHKEEARAFLPRQCFPGARSQVPDKIVKRLAAHHFVDYVQCIGYPFDYKTIEYAWLTSTVVSVKGNLVRARLTGASKTSQDGPRIEENQDQTNQWRGVEVKMLGWATYDMATQKFLQFDLVAMGHRWGGMRWHDSARNPIGFEFRLASDQPEDRIPPYAMGTEGFGLSDPYW